MNDTVTILGRVGNDPVQSETTAGVPVSNFRVASPQRRFDAKTQTWKDIGTNWYSVAAFRQLAEHVKASLHSGDAVIVTGRLKVRDWEANGRRGTSMDIEAEAIGHDLRWGSSAFARAVSRSASASSPSVDSADAVAAEAGHGPDESDDDGFALDPRSGELVSTASAGVWNESDA